MWDTGPTASQEADQGPDGRTLFGPRHAGQDRQYHLVLVAESIKPKDLKAPWNWPLDARIGDVLRARPVDARWIAGLTRGPPVDLPTGIDVVMQAKENVLTCGASRS